MRKNVHYFGSTTEAYDGSQCRDDIQKWDILVIENEGVVGLAYTWPIAITEEYGALHTVTEEIDTFEKTKELLTKWTLEYNYLSPLSEVEAIVRVHEQLDKAIQLAKDKGWKVRPNYLL